jgi:glycosyltransferase involved in cell wall biosynthesis
LVKVLLGAPVRDRAWILPRFIEHVKNLQLDDIELETLFIANDCTDNSAELLDKAGFNVIVRDNLPSKSRGHLRGQYSYEHLGVLRNILVDEFLKTDADYLFSIDTDILMKPDYLKKLVWNDLDICAMLLGNKIVGGTRVHNIMRISPKTGWYVHFQNWEDDSIIEVDLTGAVYLIKREVLENGVRYGFAPQGEDAYFCKLAQDKGYKLYCDTSLKPTHVMAQGVEVIGGK